MFELRFRDGGNRVDMFQEFLLVQLKDAGIGAVFLIPGTSSARRTCPTRMLARCLPSTRMLTLASVSPADWQRQIQGSAPSWALSALSDSSQRALPTGDFFMTSRQKRQ